MNTKGTPDVRRGEVVFIITIVLGLILGIMIKKIRIGILVGVIIGLIIVFTGWLRSKRK